MANNPSNVLRGKMGAVWVDDEQWLHVESLDGTINIEYGDIKFLGDQATYKKQTGWNGTGSLTYRKINSRVQNKMANKVKAGMTVRAKIVVKNDDPDVRGTQHIVLNDVTFDSFVLTKLDANAEFITEELPFAFSHFEIVDSIA
ncbi:phage tail tube protein [Paenibacillus aurantiacus]|uniref:Phage tail tube protein n=1 Tax=Paenibacillus aurantiacus TaxID=1936118 RepID=A0ABV5KRH4_9BACL